MYGRNAQYSNDSHFESQQKILRPPSLLGGYLFEKASHNPYHLSVGEPLRQPWGYGTAVSGSSSHEGPINDRLCGQWPLTARDYAAFIIQHPLGIPDRVHTAKNHGLLSWTESGMPRGCRITSAPKARICCRPWPTNDHFLLLSYSFMPGNILW